MFLLFTQPQGMKQFSIILIQPWLQKICLAMYEGFTLYFWYYKITIQKIIIQDRLTLVQSEVTVIASGTQVSIISSSKALQNVDVIYTGIISGFCLPPPVSKNIRIDIFLRYFYDIQYIVSLTPTMAKGISPNEPNYESRGVLCRRFSFRRRINL